MFETLAAIAVGNPFAFRYDMFADRGSLESVMRAVAGVRTYNSIYVAAHGSTSSIQGLPGQVINRAAFRNSLRRANRSHTITGLYFGSCLMCNRSNAEFFLDSKLGCNVNWVAGYSKSVDWVDSTSVDVVFWSKVLQKREENRRRKGRKKTDLALAREAADAMKSLMPTIFDQLGFNMYYLDRAGELQQVW